MAKQVIIAMRITAILLLLVSGIYPALVWGLTQAAFHHQSNGSLVRDATGHVIGSALLAQSFSQPQYFHPRPSVAGNGYDPTQSGGSNLGPTSKKLISSIKYLAIRYRQENDLPINALVPVDAVTRSGSGLDPDISVMNVDLQVARVARARGVSVVAIMHLVKRYTQSRQLGFLGEPCVNVLEINLGLDQTDPMPHP